MPKYVTSPKAGHKEIFRKLASVAKAGRAHLLKGLGHLEENDVLTVTHPARSACGLLDTLGATAERKAGFRSLGGTGADTATAHGRLILTALKGLAKLKRKPLRRIARSRNVSQGTISWPVQRMFSHIPQLQFVPSAAPKRPFTPLADLVVSPV